MHTTSSLFSKIIVLPTAVLSALGLLALGCQSKAKPEAQAEKSISVQTMTLQGQTPAGTWIQSGRVTPQRLAHISTRIMGHIAEVAVHEGQRVQAGQLLVQLSAPDVQAQMEQAKAGVLQAQAAYQNAHKDLQRFQVLWQQQSASAKELDDMQTRNDLAAAALQQAQQQWRQAQAQQAYIALKAPFAGVVSQLTVKAGDMAQPGQSLAVVEGQGSGFEVRTQLTEDQIQQVQVGQRVQVQLDALQQQVEAQVWALSTTAEAQTGLYEVVLRPLQTPQGWVSGMTATVTGHSSAKASTAQNASLRIPTQALIRQGELQGVYVVGMQQRALLRWLRLGSTQGQEVEVLSGLQPHDRVIVSAQGHLYHGVPVQVQ